jgi:hypothetical protein
MISAFGFGTWSAWVEALAVAGISISLALQGTRSADLRSANDVLQILVVQVWAGPPPTSAFIEHPVFVRFRKP